MVEPRELVVLSDATRAISKVQTLGEAKSLADRAVALKVWAAKQSWSEEQRARLGEIHTRATVRLGELLADAPKHDGGRPRKTASRKAAVIPTHADLLNLPKPKADKLAKAAQDAARVPAKVREAYIKGIKAAGEIPTPGGLARFGRHVERRGGDMNGKLPEKAQAVLDRETKKGRAINAAMSWLKNAAGACQLHDATVTGTRWIKWDRETMLRQIDTVQKHLNKWRQKLS